MKFSTRWDSLKKGQLVKLALEGEGWPDCSKRYGIVVDRLGEITRMNSFAEFSSENTRSSRSHMVLKFYES